MRRLTGPCYLAPVFTVSLLAVCLSVFTVCLAYNVNCYIILITGEFDAISSVERKDLTELGFGCAGVFDVCKRTSWSDVSSSLAASMSAFVAARSPRASLYCAMCMRMKS